MLALQLRPASPGSEATPVLAATGPQNDSVEQAGEDARVDSEIEGMLAALDENPDLYLWLAANDDTLPPPSEP